MDITEFHKRNVEMVKIRIGVGLAPMVIFYDGSQGYAFETTCKNSYDMAVKMAKPNSEFLTTVIFIKYASALNKTDGVRTHAILIITVDRLGHKIIWSNDVCVSDDGKNISFSENKIAAEITADANLSHQLIPKL